LENKHIENILNNFNVAYEEDLRHKLDSVKIINLIIEIEETFNIEIKEIDFNKTNSVKKIIDEYIDNK
jgi:acyl carrier protein